MCGRDDTFVSLSISAISVLILMTLMKLTSPAGVVGCKDFLSDFRIHGNIVNWIAPVGIPTIEVETAPRSKDAAVLGIAPAYFIGVQFTKTRRI